MAICPLQSDIFFIAVGFDGSLEFLLLISLIFPLIDKYFKCMPGSSGQCWKLFNNSNFL